MFARTQPSHGKEVLKTSRPFVFKMTKISILCHVECNVTVAIKIVKTKNDNF